MTKRKQKRVKKLKNCSVFALVFLTSREWSHDLKCDFQFLS